MGEGKEKEDKNKNSPKRKSEELRYELSPRKAAAKSVMVARFGERNHEVYKYTS